MEAWKRERGNTEERRVAARRGRRDVVGAVGGVGHSNKNIGMCALVEGCNFDDVLFSSRTQLPF